MMDDPFRTGVYALTSPEVVSLRRIRGDRDNLKGTDVDIRIRP